VGEELRADPVELAVLSQACVDAGTDVRDALKTAREEVVITGVFGNLARSEELDEGYSDALDKAATALEDLCDVVEGDADRLLQVAFAFKAQDAANAENVDKPNPRPGPSPVPSR
jgi:hypothetical protein